MIGNLLGSGITDFVYFDSFYLILSKHFMGISMGSLGWDHSSHITECSVWTVFSTFSGDSIF